MFIGAEEKHTVVVPRYSGETSKNQPFSHRLWDLISVLGDYLKIDITTYWNHVTK